MKVREFLRPLVYGGRVTVGIGARVNLVSYPGSGPGTIVFDGLTFNRGTTGPNVAGNRFITDCEAMLDLNQAFGQTEGGLYIPIFGEADAARPFFLDIQDETGVSGALAWYLLGYVGGDIVEDDGFFEPPRNARHFCRSSARGGVACANGVMTPVLSFTTPDAQHGIRLERIEFINSSAPTQQVWFGNGPGLEQYKSLALPAINGFAWPHWYPMVARLEPHTTYSIEILRTSIGTSTIGVSLHGWLW